MCSAWATAVSVPVEQDTHQFLADQFTALSMAVFLFFEAFSFPSPVIPQKLLKAFVMPTVLPTEYGSRLCELSKSLAVAPWSLNDLAAYWSQVVFPAPEQAVSVPRAVRTARPKHAVWRCRVVNLGMVEFLPYGRD